MSQNHSVGRKTLNGLSLYKGVKYWSLHFKFTEIALCIDTERLQKILEYPPESHPEFWNGMPDEDVRKYPDIFYTVVQEMLEK